MAARLQRSGEYDIFLKISPSALDQWWSLRTQVMSSCRLNVRIPLTHRTCRTGHQPGFSHPPSMAERRGEPRADTGDKVSHVAADATWKNPLSKHAASRFRVALFGRHCSFIHTIPAPQQRSAVYRRHSFIHMIPAPHQRLPWVEDTLSFTWYQPHISSCRV